MDSIDSIIDMLDWNNTAETQEKGLELGRKEKDISGFIQPKRGKNNGKYVWANCALIVSDRNDDELEPHLNGLFHWIADFNWPGSECIFERLKRFSVNDRFLSVIKKCMVKADEEDDEGWFYSLEELYDQATAGQENGVIDLIIQRKFEEASCHEDLQNDIIFRKLSAEANIKFDMIFHDFAKYMYEKTADIKWLKLMRKILVDTFSFGDGIPTAISYQREIVEKEKRSIDSLEGLLQFYTESDDFSEEEARELAKEITAIDPDNQLVKVLFSDEYQNLRRRRLKGEFDQSFNLITQTLEELNAKSV